jgi:[acyl-carrier-protein] S-malonyltransferase
MYSGLNLLTTMKDQKMKSNLIFLYPGQGSQYRGMGYDICESFPEARKIFDRADRYLNFPLSRLCFEGSEDELNSDLNAQLAVYTTSCAVTEILRARHIEPAGVAGYSSGFYAAAYAADCFDFVAGLDLVRRAGQILIDEGRNIKGSMAVIFGLPGEQVESICRRTGTVDVAIRNTHRQIIVSGIQSSVAQVMETALAEGALDVYLLPVATAYHSTHMAGSTILFRRYLDTVRVRPPRTALFSYSSLNRVADEEDLKATMADQLSSPVLWVDVIEILRSAGNSLFIEAGPGTVLYRTVRWIDRTIEAMTTDTAASVKAVLARYAMEKNAGGGEVSSAWHL